MERKSVFLYNHNEANNIFILAIAKKLGFQLWSLENLWDLINTNYSPIFIISDKTFLDFPDLLTYLGMPGDKIGGYINVNNIQSNDPNPDINLILIYLNRDHMLKNTEDINCIANWERNPLAARYGKALTMARIFIKNQNKPSPWKELKWREIINEAITEINEAKQSYDISRYADRYDNYLANLNEAKAKISTKKPPIRLGNKPIAYGYLDNISPWLDLDKLKRDLLVLYPFIVIIQYRQDDNEYTWIASDKILNVNLIFNIKNNNKNPYEATIGYPSNKVIYLLRKRVKRISS